jgi:hypothetical protein
MSIVAVIAPGPTRSGKPIGTAPRPSGELEGSCHPPAIRSLTAIMRSKSPPATMKLFNDMPNNMRICCPAKAKRNRRINPVIMADLKVVFLWASSMFFVRPMKMGTLPNGSTTMKRAIVPFTRSRRKSIDAELPSTNIIKKTAVLKSITQLKKFLNREKIKKWGLFWFFGTSQF